MKRKFYIISHNPNKIGNQTTQDTASWALHLGANALEPDISFDHNEFWVFHRTIFNLNHDSDTLTLKDYCIGLANLLIQNPQFNLALIAWDLKNVKDSGFVFTKLRDIIQTNFLDVLAANNYREMPMLFTHPTNYNHLLQWVFSNSYKSFQS